MMAKSDLRDAYGRAFRDYFDGAGDGYEILERDDGFIEVSDGRGSYLAKFEDWPARHRQALRHVAGRVLDIGCGAGRHALHLQTKGLDVLGIDASPLAVAVCRRRGLRNVKVLSLDDVTRSLGTFTTVLMLGNNFGVLANPARARRLLRKLYTITDADARIIAETIDIYHADNPFFLDRSYHRRNTKRGRMAGQLRMRIRYEDSATPWFDHLFVSRAEMRKLLQGTGWRVARWIPPRGAFYVAVIVKNNQSLGRALEPGTKGKPRRP